MNSTFKHKYAGRLIQLLIASLSFISGQLLADTLPADPGTLHEGSACTFSGTYEQEKELRGIDQPVSSTGILYYDCKQGVIWKTIEPIGQSLVLIKEGPAYRIESDEASKIKNRQAKVLAEIISSFVASDYERLAEYFLIDSSTMDKTTLTPKTKHLKRAFERVIVRTEGAEHQRIEITDRHGLRTRISATKNRNQNAHTNCRALSLFSELECSLLDPEHSTDMQ